MKKDRTEKKVKTDKVFDKKEALEEMVKKLEHDYGKGIVMQMDDSFKMNVKTTSSGSLLIDQALGVGGYPKGRVVEIFGPESSGKTTLALHAVAEAQKSGGTCAFVDAEHALDMKYARQIGVDPKSLYLSQPENGEQALEIVDSFITSRAIDMVVIDSVAALVPKAEIDGNMGDAQMALQARLMSKALRKITGHLSKAGTTIIFINQLRMKIGIVYGNPETTTGGNALKFYASIRIDVRKGETLKKGDEIYGSKTRVKIVKNKVAPPFKNAEITIIYGEGISKFQEIIDLAVKFEIIRRSGTWYSYNDSRIGQGQESVKKLLRENHELFKEIGLKVKKKIAGESVEKPTPNHTTSKTRESKPGKDDHTEKVPSSPVKENSEDIPIVKEIE